MEKAFGIIPAIILTSAFYSLHHAGFQPEFVHLFLVGLMYCSIFYITRNMLIIFPFFWGVGALWDVLVSSEAGDEIKNPVSFVIALVILSATALWIFYRKRIGLSCGICIYAVLSLFFEVAKIASADIFTQGLVINWF